MSVIVVDIETLPDLTEGHMDRAAESVAHPAQMKKPETIKAWHEGLAPYEGVKDSIVREKHRRTALSGDYGTILCICAIDFETGERATFYADGPGIDEPFTINTFWEWCDRVTGHKLANPYFIAHNAEFDLSFLWKRSIVHGIEPLVKRNGRHGKDHFCTSIGWAGYKDRISLDNLAKILKLDSHKGDMDGSKVYDAWLNGEHKEIQSYCMNDVLLTSRIYERIK